MSLVSWKDSSVWPVSLSPHTDLHKIPTAPLLHSLTPIWIILLKERICLLQERICLLFRKEYVCFLFIEGSPSSESINYGIRFNLLRGELKRKLNNTLISHLSSVFIPIIIMHIIIHFGLAKVKGREERNQTGKRSQKKKKGMDDPFILYLFRKGSPGRRTLGEIHWESYSCASTDSSGVSSYREEERVYTRNSSNLAFWRKIAINCFRRTSNISSVS